MHLTRADASEASNEWWFDATPQAASLRGERLASFPDARSVRAWTDVVERRGTQRRWLLRAQAFDSQGDADGEVFTLSANPSDCAATFRGAPLRDHHFAVVWIESSRGDSVGHACTRVFDLRGFPLGAEIALGDALASEPSLLAISAAAGGGYVCAWVGVDGAGNARVHAASFDAIGTQRGPITCVSAQAVATPCPVRLTRLDGGGFVVSWADHAATRGTPIRTQMFDACGERVGGEYLCSFRG